MLVGERTRVDRQNDRKGATTRNKKRCTAIHTRRIFGYIEEYDCTENVLKILETLERAIDIV